MKLFTLSVPSKTFLLGEYLATQGGTAIIANTTPRFTLKVSAMEVATTGCEGISPASPAGRFYHRHIKNFQNLSLKFVDPHEGHGGLGASSAQYALLISLKEALSQLDLRSYFRNFQPNTGFKYLDEYTSDSWNGEGVRPSGTDMISQLAGKVSVVQSKTNGLLMMSWPFDNLSFLLVRTGQKLATHEHLKNVGVIPSNPLEQVCQMALDSLETKNEKGFLSAVRMYSDMLQQMRALAPKSGELLKQISTSNHILAAKGCGAMGADVLLLLFNKENTNSVKEWIAGLGLQTVAGSEDLTSGLELSLPDVYKTPEVQT